MTVTLSPKSPAILLNCLHLYLEILLCLLKLNDLELKLMRLLNLLEVLLLLELLHLVDLLLKIVLGYV